MDTPTLAAVLTELIRLSVDYRHPANRALFTALADWLSAQGLPASFEDSLTVLHDGTPEQAQVHARLQADLSQAHDEARTAQTSLTAILENPSLTPDEALAQVRQFLQ